MHPDDIEQIGKDALHEMAGAGEKVAEDGGSYAAANITGVTVQKAENGFVLHVYDEYREGSRIQICSSIEEVCAALPELLA